MDYGYVVKVVYGYITDIYTGDEEEEQDDYYIVQIQRENTVNPTNSDYEYIALEQTPEELAALYGAPSDLIGKRVRVDYTGRDFRSGTARIVADVVPRGGQSLTEIESRGFRYAVPGEGRSI